MEAPSHVEQWPGFSCKSDKMSSHISLCVEQKLLPQRLLCFKQLVLFKVSPLHQQSKMLQICYAKSNKSISLCSHLQSVAHFTFAEPIASNTNKYFAYPVLAKFVQYVMTTALSITSFFEKLQGNRSVGPIMGMPKT